MKEVFIAYFDFLGFKEFMQNNSDEQVIIRMGHIFRDVESVLSENNYHPPQNGVVVADLSKSKVNCLNISDTVVFWTNDCQIESLKKIVQLAYHFNWRQNLYNFPVRGSITRGKLALHKLTERNKENNLYSIDCLYGRGIVDAHLKTENQNWAGTVIDNGILDIFQNVLEAEEFLKDFAIRYKVPYKKGNIDEEFVLKFSKDPMNEEDCRVWGEKIEGVFEKDNKPTDDERVKDKIKNTLKFLKEFKIES